MELPRIDHQGPTPDPRELVFDLEAIEPGGLGKDLG